jgi:iron(III) transport system permease protein
MLRRHRWMPAAIISVWLGIGIAIPVAGLVLGSFLKFISPTISFEQFTLNNYIQVFGGNGMTAITNSILLAVLAGTITALLGALVSYAVQRTKVPGRGLLDYLSSATVAIPGMTLALGLLWTYVRAPGAIWGSIIILLIAYIARFISHGVRITSLSLLPISPSLEESAQVLGAGMWRRLRTITLPLMRPGLLSAWVLVFIFAINEVSATVLLYGPRSLTIAMAAWNAAQTTGAQRAFAYAVIQGAIVAIILIVAYRLVRSAGPGSTEVAHIKKERRRG